MKTRVIITLIIHLLDYLISQNGNKVDTGFVSEQKRMLRKTFLNRSKENKE
ncbi:MAG: hypothetical protein FWG98_07920 [Candidatus Cloacimonetes bacterium]|nr:hypothetical protein [Candidatus Cloacimonadota bacterium]